MQVLKLKSGFAGNPICYGLLLSFLFSSVLAGCMGSNTSTSISAENHAETRHVTSQAVPANYQTVVQQLYIAYFGRPADTGGLSNFEAALNTAGAPNAIADLATAYNSNPAVKSLTDSFGTSAESNTLYAGDTTAFVKAVFNNLLERDPQTAGLAFWVDAINSGRLTKGNAALSIMAGALANTTAQGLQDAALVNKKIAIGTAFTAAITAPEQVDAYRGQAAAATVRSMLSSVSANTDLVAFQTTINSTLATLVSNGKLQGIFDAPNPVFDPNITFLENGEVYGIDMISGRVAGMFHGTVSGGNAALSASLTEYNAWDGGFVQQASLSATYTKPSLSLTLTFPFGIFSSSATGQKTYGPNDSHSIYDNPASLSSLVGTYSGELSSVGTTFNRYSSVSGMSLNGTGAFQTTVGNCAFDGTMVPHGSSGVFDVTITAGGSSCVLAGQFAGIVTPMALTASSATLAFQTISTDGTKSAVFYVSR